MLPPNAVTWNLLKRRTLGDSRGTLPIPQETTFPDYELISTSWEAISRAFENQKSTRSRNVLHDDSGPRYFFGALALGTS